MFVVYGDRDISAGKFRCTKAFVLRQVIILSVEVKANSPLCCSPPTGAELDTNKQRNESH
jgi:hypothetical protein